MAIVKSLVDKMNGTISVTSKEGEGSTFVIRIPFEIASKVEEITDDKQKSSNDISGIKILLAEDMNLMLRLHRLFWWMKALMLLLSVMVSRLSGNLQGVHHIHMM